MRSLVSAVVFGLLISNAVSETNSSSLYAIPPAEAWKASLIKKPIRAYCIDFNWLVDGQHVFPEPGHWSDAEPRAHVKWYKAAGANCIQTFVLSANGYAWYKGGPIPEQPGLKYDFLPEVVRLGHKEKMLVMGYYCIGANTLWGKLHPEQSYGTPSWMHIPLTKDYIDYLCVSVVDALKKTGIDGFMLDWMVNTSGAWLDCEKTMYQELMGVPFPGADKITPADLEKFDDLAVRRCWTRIRDTARKVKPDCILWPNGLNHLKLEGVDWLLNEGPDVETTEAASLKLNGRPVRLIQNQVGWSKHDARKVFSNPKYKDWDFYGFAAPYDNSLPLPAAEYLKRPIDDFKGYSAMTINDRNIAALIRFYRGKPVEPPPPVPVDLRCEYLQNPLGVDVVKPRLSWKTGGRAEGGNLKPERGIKQTAYQVLVASSENILDKDQGDLWDSGKVGSDQSVHVEYKGKQLESGMRCFWKVKVWKEKPETQEASGWSETASWTMGLLKPDDWQGKWIKSDLELYEYQKELKKVPDHDREAESPMWERSRGIRKMTEGITNAPAVWLRKEFSASGKPLRSARCCVSGLGFYELYINGRKVNDQFINVAPYDYDKAVPYQVHDVIQLLRGGTNAIGVILGNGYFNPIIPSTLREYAADFIDTPRMLLGMILEYEDGSVQRVVSDCTWKYTTGGPIRFNSVRAGETYDARMELGDWSSPGYSMESWKAAMAAEPPTGNLINQNLPPVRRIAEIPAVSVVKEGDGYRFDIGVEATGWARLKVRGKPGQKITIRYPGSVSHTLGRYQECRYICRGDGEETYEPRFAFNGYRFVDVSGLDYEPKPSDLVGCEVVCDLKRTGQFSCSSPELNKIQEAIIRTILNYNIQIPMDPVREKVGWTQDVQSNFKVTACNFDVSRIYQKWQEDFVLSIHADGYVPTVVPGCFDGPTINGPWWGGMIVYSPWQFYNFYGDRRILERSYESMKRYVSYLDSIATNNIISWGLGDWKDTTADCRQGSRPNCTTVPFTSTCAYMMYNDMVSETALLLGKADDVARYAARVEEIRAAINGRFFNASTGVYDKGSQTGYALALVLGVPAEADRPRVTENLKAQIASDGFHVTSGFVGIPILLTYLTEHGMGDLAWRIATRPTYPGWFNMILTLKNSVLKEDWAGHAVQMPSLAAPIGEWFYRCLGGIRPGSPGFKSIIIQPYTETLDWVKCEYESPYGLIVSNWQKEDGKLVMDVTIPANTTATVYVPAKTEKDVTESGESIAQAEGIKFLRMENGAAVYEVGSGVYRFESKQTAFR